MYHNQLGSKYPVPLSGQNIKQNKITDTLVQFNIYLKDEINIILFKIINVFKF